MKYRREKIEEKEDMKKYCGNCGADLPIDAKFCGNCGTVLGQTPLPDARDSVETEHSSQQPGQHQGYTGQSPKKLNTKVLAVVGILVAAVVLAVVLLVLFAGGGGGGYSSQFVGAWNIVSGGSSDSPYTTYVFEANGDFKVGSSGDYVRVGTWRTDSGILYVEAIPDTYSSSGATGISARYMFSDGGRTLTLYPTNSETPAVFTKQ